jgi:hypothetical protein
MPTLAQQTDLRTLVRETLCELNGLAAEAFEMSERELIRAGKRCGLLFCIHGPRSVQLTAVWDQERHLVLFYGSAGERLQSMQLKSNVVTW